MCSRASCLETVTGSWSIDRGIVKSNSRAHPVVVIVQQRRFQGRAFRLGRTLRSGLDVRVSLTAKQNKGAGPTRVRGGDEGPGSAHAGAGATHAGASVYAAWPLCLRGRV